MRGGHSRSLLVAAFLVAGAAIAAIQVGPRWSQGTPQFSGQVTYNGRPLKDQMIVFVARDLKSDNWGFACTDGDGRFSVSATLGERRLAPGTYRIFFRKPGQSRVIRYRGGSERVDMTATAALPDRFYDADQSGLWAKMGPTARWIRIDLRDGPHA
ncbi:hypothetical protein OJF2_32950 [Aquisphaera giovannonii]|uniref:Carboxypeptidase regulatory-like domain-containing protein n=1 Tax=Aquisphaera giovannonii TaxID=406548 RepID=A0A5B9W2E7_9BACT|nr:hypothetical protein [Aquisphaera giovannonii]QEH34753.1 hypothetical protein OJF2_32950 [Aquisphaera giovannonii]